MCRQRVLLAPPIIAVWRAAHFNSLALAVGETPDPILESPANLFLISKLGCNLPIGYPFSTITYD